LHINHSLKFVSHGGGDTGWSRAWAISLSARSFLPNEVHHSLIHLLTVLTYPTSLLDTGPPAPFQIDGNFGGPAGIAEALIQSHELVASTDSATATVDSGKQLEPAYWGYGEGEKTTLIRLLPALPTEWASNGGGFVRGLRARGGFEVDIAWNDNGSLKSAHIKSLLGKAAWITVGSEPIGTDAARTNATGKRISVDGGHFGIFVLLSAEAGRTHSVSA
jgi:alpha-L-fucosidase 2